MPKGIASAVRCCIMGKNQQHKAMQRGKGSEEDGPPGLPDEPGADVSFHTAEWHAAR